MRIMPDLSGPRSRLGDAMRAAQASQGSADQLRLASPGAERVPLYSQGRLAAFVRRTSHADTPYPSASAAPREQSSDLGLSRAIAARFESEAGGPAARTGISATNGIVRLSGSVETVHDRMALCRIAAAINETVAIIDELWVDCE